eukprot:758904-Hanusia_phi.AAC.4
MAGFAKMQAYTKISAPLAPLSPRFLLVLDPPPLPPHSNSVSAHPRFKSLWHSKGMLQDQQSNDLRGRVKPDDGVPPERRKSMPCEKQRMLSALTHSIRMIETAIAAKGSMPQPALLPAVQEIQIHHRRFSI